MDRPGKVVANAGGAAGTKPPSPWQHYRGALYQGYLVVAVVVFLILAVLAKTVAYFTFDVTITHAVQRFHAIWFDGPMDWLSWIGFVPQSEIITAALIVLLYLIRLKWETVVSLVSVIGSEGLGQGIKALIDRPRPSSDLVTVDSVLKSYSFPSGHVLFFVTFFGFLLFLTVTLVKPSWWRTILLVVLGAMIALIGISRIYEGQHWASDVIGSYLLGSVWLALTVMVYNWGKSRYFVKETVDREKSATQ